MRRAILLVPALVFVVAADRDCNPDTLDCEVDADCPEPLLCLGVTAEETRVCVPSPTCADDADCVGGARCAGGFCSGECPASDGARGCGSVTDVVCTARGLLCDIGEDAACGQCRDPEALTGCGAFEDPSTDPSALLTAATFTPVEEPGCGSLRAFQLAFAVERPVDSLGAPLPLTYSSLEVRLLGQESPLQNVDLPPQPLPTSTPIGTTLAAGVRFGFVNTVVCIGGTNELPFTAGVRLRSQANPLSNSICVDGPQGQGVCNGVAFDGATAQCCGGVLLPVENVCAICEGIQFNPDAEMCCPDGSISTLVRQCGTAPCGGDTFDSDVEQCCGDVVLPRADACNTCGGVFFDASQSQCCGGAVIVAADASCDALRCSADEDCLFAGALCDEPNAACVDAATFVGDCASASTLPPRDTDGPVLMELAFLSDIAGACNGGDVEKLFGMRVFGVPGGLPSFAVGTTVLPARTLGPALTVGAGIYEQEASVCVDPASTEIAASVSGGGFTTNPACVELIAGPPAGCTTQGDPRCLGDGLLCLLDGSASDATCVDPSLVYSCAAQDVFPVDLVDGFGGPRDGDATGSLFYDLVVEGGGHSCGVGQTALNLRGTAKAKPAGSFSSVIDTDDVRIASDTDAGLLTPAGAVFVQTNFADFSQFFSIPVCVTGSPTSLAMQWRTSNIGPPEPLSVIACAVP